MSPTCLRCLSLFHFRIYSLWNLVRFFFQIWTDLCLTIFGFIPFLFTHPGCVFEIYKMKITLSLSVSWILTLNMLRFLIFISLVGSLICQNNPPNILFILADDLGDFLCIITFYNKRENMRHFFLNAQIHLTPVLTFSLKHFKKMFRQFWFYNFQTHLDFCLFV